MRMTLQLCHYGFDVAFFELPGDVKARIQAEIDQMWFRLNTFTHPRLKG